MEISKTGEFESGQIKPISEFTELTLLCLQGGDHGGWERVWGGFLDQGQGKWEGKRGVLGKNFEIARESSRRAHPCRSRVARRIGAQYYWEEFLAKISDCLSSGLKAQAS